MFQVLLIEDNPVDANAIQDALAQVANEPLFTSFEVTRADMLGRGLSLLKSRPFDAILLDLDLPDARDFTGVDILRTEFPRSPVIVLTKLRDDIAIATEALKRGAQDYFSKYQLADPLALARIVRYAVERKKAEEALIIAREDAVQAAKAKSEFLSNMSHDIRTPLNCIIGVADLLSRAGLSEEQRNHVNMMNRASDTLLSLINNILDLSKIESGKIEITHQAFNLLETMEEIIDIIATRAHAKNLEVIFHMEFGLSYHRVGDPGLLSQILVNLLSNAVKFTKSGEITLAICRISARSGVASLRFSVSDTGVGIPADKCDAVFESFSQLDQQDISLKRQGAGLGLAICKQLTELMGGEIRVQSQVGVGSCFEIDLPLPHSGAEEETDESLKQSLEGIQILVVDDNPAHALMLKNLLESWNASVATAHNHHQAEELIGQMVADDQKYDVAILDLRMPGVGAGGLELATRFQNSLRAVVMMLPTNHRAGDIERLKAANINLYYFKPTKPERLALIMAQALGRVAMPVPMPEKMGVPFESGEKLRILVADDSEDNRLLMMAYFQDENIALKVAENGDEAVSIYKDSKFDLILMDIQMPLMDGYQALKAIREWELSNGLDQVPVVALTAFALKQDTDRCLSAGFGAHVTKPLTKGSLMAVVRRYKEISCQ